MPSADSKRQKTVASANAHAIARLARSVAVPGEPYALAALPPKPLKLIFAYASDEFQERAYVPAQFYPKKSTSLRYLMPHLLTVSKAWSRAIAGIADEFNAVTHTIRLQLGLPDELSRVHKALEAKGGGIQDLRVWFGASHWTRYYIPQEVRPSLVNADQLEIDWHRVFASCPHLVRLDLSLVPLNSKHLFKILDAASTHCRGIQSLIFLEYQTQYQSGPRRPDFPGIMCQISQALQRWYQYQGPSGGIRQLSVPNKELPDYDSDEVGAGEFWDEVATFCPNIEYLQGWKKVTLRNLYSDDDSTMTLPCTLDSWYNFCKSCTQLREFYWYMVPLDDALLDIFAEYPKLNMKTMVFACGSYFGNEKTFVSQQFRRRGGLKVTSNGIIKAIKACPALEELGFWIGHAGCNTYGLERATNDNVLCTVGANCLGLKKLTICESYGEGGSSTMSGISDSGIIAISRLPKLEHIALTQIKISAEGILALIHNSPNPQLKRRVVIEVGCTEGDSVDFFQELEKFMKLLVSLPADSLQGHRFELELQMKFYDRNESSEPVRVNISALKHQVVARHPDMTAKFASDRSVRDDILPQDLDDLESVFFISPREMARCSDRVFDTCFD